MSGFEIPDWAMPQTADAPPPPDPAALRRQQIADNTRAEQALNGFIAGKQAALFEAPDAFYRAQGEDAIHAAPMATQKLDELRRNLLNRLGNDTQRERLADALDAQMHLAREGMARHVAEQSLEWQRGVAQDRIALLAKEASLHHNDDGLVDSLGHAAATAARAHARVGDGPPGGDAEDTAAATARSGVLGAAIQARLDRGDTEGANALFIQMQDQLDPEHAAPLQGQIDAGTTEVVPDQEFQTAQSILPFLAKPPVVPDISKGPSGGPLKDPGSGPSPGGTKPTPQFKEPVPNQSGKQGAKDIPTWARQQGTRPYLDETPTETATRAMNERYGKENWDGGGEHYREFNQLKKFYGRHFQNPKDLPGPFEAPYGLPGGDREACPGEKPKYKRRLLYPETCIR